MQCSLLALVGLALAAGCADKVGTAVPPTTLAHSHPLRTMTVSPASAIIFMADTVRLHATVDTTAGLSRADSIGWTSSDTIIARVDASGLVRGLAKGTVTIIATDVRVPAAQGASAITVVSK